MTLYDLEITIEEMEDGGDYRYLATSPDLPNLLVAGDTVDEVLSLAPQIGCRPDCLDERRPGIPCRKACRGFWRGPDRDDFDQA